MFVTRRIRSDDWQALRGLRLAALSDEPSAFGSTYGDELAAPDRRWKELAAVRSAGLDGANFFAVDPSGIPCGIVGIFPVGASAAELTSMWVAPPARGQGVGALLVNAAVEWADSAGCSEVELWVTRGNDRARSLYAGLGFVETNDVKPLPSDPCKDEVRMRLTRGPEGWPGRYSGVT